MVSAPALDVLINLIHFIPSYRLSFLDVFAGKFQADLRTEQQRRPDQASAQGYRIWQRCQRRNPARHDRGALHQVHVSENIMWLCLRLLFIISIIVSNCFLLGRIDGKCGVKLNSMQLA